MLRLAAQAQAAAGVDHEPPPLDEQLGQQFDPHGMDRGAGPWSSIRMEVGPSGISRGAGSGFVDGIPKAVLLVLLLRLPAVMPVTPIEDPGR